LELAAHEAFKREAEFFMKNILRTLWLIFYCCWMFPLCLSAQKFHFQNYNVQQGLIQSQVMAITQDKFDNLWFCTLGGISRFDGREFTNYSETDGLISNHTNSIIADHESNMWIGTVYGLSRFNGAGFKNIRFSAAPDGNVVRSIKEDGRSRIWVLVGNKLFRIDQNAKPVQSTVSGVFEKISSIQVDDRGNLFAAVVHKGIYRLLNDKWTLELPVSENYDGMSYENIVFDRQSSDKFYLLTGDAIYSAENGTTRELIRPGSMGKISSIYQDKSYKLWFTCSRGLYQYADSGLHAFRPDNGYEGNNTSVIFQDREDNIWLGTNGTGVFRYSYQPFLIYDQFSSTRNTAIMPMLLDHDRLYAGSDGGGLFEYDGKNFNPVKGFSDNPGDQHIGGIFHGSGKEIYVLSGSGLYKKYDNQKPVRVPIVDGKGCIVDLLPDEKGGFWIAGCSGLYYLSSHGKRSSVMNYYSNKIMRVSDDSLLVGADDGLYMVSMDFKYRKINDSLLNAANYMGFSSLGKFYLLATSNKGFIIFDPATGESKQFTTKNGLNSDFIYSVISDHQRQIWLGTGRGVNKIILDTTSQAVQISNLSVPGDISSAECNQGAAILDGKNNLWFGTVSGLFKFLPDSGKKQTYLPPVVLQEVRVFSKDISPTRFAGMANNWFSIPKNLTLPHNENHLTFYFRCPSYLHSESILYQYQLEGMEKSYSALTPNHFVVYPALPPGHYIFRARAYLEGVGYSKENVAFVFDIKAAFYQTAYFKFLLLVLAMGLILWIQWLRIRWRVKRLKHIEEVKHEENIKVRQTASEDFHDEVGNSLTRIQVLTDVLHSKLGNGHDEEKRIIGQIKENVSGLYQGTRDILWALNPESDVLKEIGLRLESLGIDVFQDTGICFSYENLLEEAEHVKLPGNYNRNIMMIFKEAMSNSLKHAQARHVKIKMQQSETREILIELTDDGIGFNQLFIKKGHGFQNMQKRANRIKSFFTAFSRPGDGSRYELRIPVSPV
jgi:signal transduction histidine kinase/ligand-binding sensor domain-containing protein